MHCCGNKVHKITKSQNHNTSTPSSNQQPPFNHLRNGMTARIKSETTVAQSVDLSLAVGKKEYVTSLTAFTNLRNSLLHPLIRSLQSNVNFRTSKINTHALLLFVLRFA